MIFRTTDMALIAVMVAAAAFTYKTKHDAENQLDKLHKVESQIRFEEDTINILKADWSLLTQPGRIQRLTNLYGEQLGLVPVEPQQIVKLDAIPLKPVVSDPIADAIAASTIGTDKITTGGVSR